jgi:hypothetical protein
VPFSDEVSDWARIALSQAGLESGRDNVKMKNSSMAAADEMRVAYNTLRFRP